ncbi:hypothetical protein J6590_091576 [Homalodisca vitripennis]|nr:hypothetical protein J6590_091576 [Homalodisca vitripennis]
METTISRQTGLRGHEHIVCYNMPRHAQKPMCNLNLGNFMDVQERHITNHKCRDPGVCHSLPALTGEAGSERAFPSSVGT